MGEKSKQIEREIERERAQLGASIEELEHKVKGMIDWREQFRRSPFTMLGFAFGGGLLLATAVNRRSRGR